MARISLFLTVFLASCASILSIPNFAHALTITPIRYEIQGDPGQTLKEEMTLVNETKTAQTYYASFANFEAQGDSGSPTFIDPREGLGTWMATDVASINLAPGQQKVVPFTITIPKNAEPGGHFAAIFWGTSFGSKPGELTIGAKTGLLVLLTVNGDIAESAGLVDFQTHNKKHFFRALPVGFQYRFSNQGGDRVKPDGNIVVRSIFGWRVQKINANPFDGNVLPGTTRKFTTEWAKKDSVADRDEVAALGAPYSFTKTLAYEWHNFALGIFRAKLDAQFGATAQHIKSKSVYFVVVPWELLLVCIVVGTPLYFILRAMLRKYNRAIIRRAQQLGTAKSQ